MKELRTGLVQGLPRLTLGVVSAVFGSSVGRRSVFSYSNAEFVPCDVVPIPEVEMETAALWVGLRFLGEP